MTGNSGYVYDVFRCTDRWDREIALRDDRWYGKILVQRPALTNHEGAVRTVLTQPEVVTYDKHRGGVEVFYARVTLPSPLGRTLLKVCVAFTPAGTGRASEGTVLTAYPVLNVHPLEQQKWP